MEAAVRAVGVERDRSGWVVSGKNYPRPEPAALALLEADGWLGACCEGGPILLLIKAACLDLLERLNPLGPEDAVTRYVEAQFTMLSSHTGPLIQAVANCPARRMLRNFDRIYASTFVKEAYPGVTAELLEGLHRGLGNKLEEVARRFATAPYSYRCGWPDISAVKKGQILLQEVKTRDSLHESQIRLFTDILMPLRLPAEVLQLVPAARLKAR